MSLGNIQYQLLELCSVHDVTLNRLAKQSEAKSFGVVYMKTNVKINAKVDRKRARFFSNSVNLDSKSLLK